MNLAAIRDRLGDAAFAGFRSIDGSRSDAKAGKAQAGKVNAAKVGKIAGAKVGKFDV